MAPDGHECSETIKCDKVMGFLFALLAASSYAVSGLIFKLAKDAGADEIQFSRSLLQYILVLPIATYKKKDIIAKDLKTNIILLFRGFTGVVANWTRFYAILFIPLGDAVSIVNTYVTLTGLFACICLKERCSLLDALLSILTFVGLLLVARPSFIFGNISTETPEHITAGVLLAFGSAVLASITIVCIRKLGSEIHFSVSMFHYTWIGLAFSLASAFSKGALSIPCTHDLIVLFLSAITGISGQMFMTLALQKDKAGQVVVVQSTEIIFALLLQLIVFRYYPTLTSLIGSLLIFGCSFVLTLKNTRSKTNKEDKTDSTSIDNVALKKQ